MSAKKAIMDRIRKSTLSKTIVLNVQKKALWVFVNSIITKVDVNEENEAPYAKTNGFLTILQIRKSTLTRKIGFYM